MAVSLAASYHIVHSFGPGCVRILMSAVDMSSPGATESHFSGLDTRLGLTAALQVSGPSTSAFVAGLSGVVELPCHRQDLLGSLAQQ